MNEKKSKDRFTVRQVNNRKILVNVQSLGFLLRRNGRLPWTSILVDAHFG